METPELCFRWLDIKKACQYEMAAVPTEWLRLSGGWYYPQG